VGVQVWVAEEVGRMEGESGAEAAREVGVSAHEEVERPRGGAALSFLHRIECPSPSRGEGG
jgi:hypothetical protein